jgi:general secretion pathway protein D
MKNIQSFCALAIFAGTICAASARQTNDATPPADAAAAAVAPAATNAAPAPAAETPAAPAARSDGLIMMNFRNASLDTVLNHLSDAAGYVINVKPGTSVRGKVDVWSAQPLTKEEALNLLQTVLHQNNLAAIENDRTLSIVPLDEAKINSVRVHLEKEPSKIPKTDEVATYIIPVQFVEVSQLLKDLQPLVSSQNTTMTANESGNAIVITDTQANIHRIAEIIKDIDQGAQSFSEVRVFKLVNADASETADLLTNLFPDDSRSGGSGGGGSSPFSRFASRFGFGGGGGGGGPPGFGGGGGPPGGGGGNDQRVKKRARVIAIADQRTASVVVSAAKDLMEQIDGVVKELDADDHGKMMVKSIPVENADLQQLNYALQDLFNKNTQVNNRNNQANQQTLLNNRNSVQNTANTRSSSTGFGSNSGRSGSAGSLLQP